MDVDEVVRSVYLERQIARLVERGATLEASFENEFTLAVPSNGGYESVDESLCFYASDAARTPELYYLAARSWRRALAEMLPELLPEDEVEDAARLILGDNARALYGL